MKEEYAKTGCHLLDIFFGGGRGLGIPYGHMVNLCGDSGSGKSMIGNELIAAETHRRKDKFVHQYEDAEKGNQFDTTALYGTDIMGGNLLLKHPSAKKMGKTPETVEDLDARATIFINMIPKGAYGIYFVDSLDAVTDESNKKRNKERAEAYEKGKTYDEGTYGTGAARFLSQEFFKNMGAKAQGRKAIICLVSQVRQVMGATKYQKKTRTTGGKAKKHWMDIEVWFKIIREMKNEGSDLVNGLYVEVEGMKSRDGRMKRKARFLYYTDYGIDDIGSSIDYLFDLRNDSGELRKNECKAIYWDQGKDKPEINLKNVTDWLKQDEKRLAEYREYRYDADGKKNIAASWVKQFVSESEKLQESFDAHFGKPYTRDTLYAACHEDKDMARELKRRVTKKWEDLEKAAESPAHRLGSKYG